MKTQKSKELNAHQRSNLAWEKAQPRILEDLKELCHVDHFDHKALGVALEGIFYIQEAEFVREWRDAFEGWLKDRQAWDSPAPAAALAPKWHKLLTDFATALDAFLKELRDSQP